MISPELQSRITTLQQKAMADTITMEEMREVILGLRQGRVNAESAAKSGTKRVKAPVRSEGDLLSELGGLS